MVVRTLGVGVAGVRFALARQLIMENFKNYSLSHSQKENFKNGSENHQPDFVEKIIKIKVYKGRKEKKEKITEEDLIKIKERILKELEKFEKGEYQKAKIFDPLIEFQKLAFLSKEERKKAYQEFKEKLMTQKYGWAQCQSLVETFIEFFPDIEKDFLVSKLIELYKNYFGFCEWQIEKAKEILDWYYQYRQNAKTALEKYDDPLVLVKDLTNINLPQEDQKKIKTTLGLMSVDILTDAEIAFKLYHKTENPININLEKFRTLGFTKPPQFKKDEVLYTVINLSNQPSFDKEGMLTRTHEWQHLKNAIFEKLFHLSVDTITAKKYLNLYKEEKTKEKPNQALKEILLRNYLKYKKKEVLNRTKDELFALIEKTPPQYLEPKFLATFFVGGKPAYNYPERIFLKNLESDQLYKQFFEEVFKEEYPEIVKNACRAFVELINFIHKEKKENVNTVAKARAFLMDKPLENWPRMVKRLMETSHQKTGK